MIHRHSEDTNVGLSSAHRMNDEQPGPCVQQHQLSLHESKPAAVGTAVISAHNFTNETQNVLSLRMKN